nr:hypothetical protein [Tanacetum cinerariifolium]
AANQPVVVAGRSVEPRKLRVGRVDDIIEAGLGQTGLTGRAGGSAVELGAQQRVANVNRAVLVLLVIGQHQLIINRAPNDTIIHLHRQRTTLGGIEGRHVGEAQRRRAAHGARGGIIGDSAVVERVGAAIA